MIDILDHDDANLHGHTEERQKPHAARHTEVRPGNQEREDSADRSHRHVRERQRSPLRRFEHGEENDVDDEDGNRQHDHQAALRALLAFIFAGPVDAITDRKLHLRPHLLHCFFHRASQVPAAHAVLDGDITRIRFAVDFRRAVPHLRVGELRQGNARSRWSNDTDTLNGLTRVAIGLEVADRQVVALLVLQNLRDRLAADGRFNRVLHVTHIYPVARRFPPVDAQVQVGLPQHPKQAQVLYARHPAHHCNDFVSFRLQLLQVIAVHLDGQFALHATDRFFHVVRNRL